MQSSFRRKVAILIPVYRVQLLDEERPSLVHLRKFLGDHERILILPRSLRLSSELFGDFRQERFSDNYFTGIDSYNRLMLSAGFYKRFLGYEYILIYQLDSLVFSGDLLSWCDRGWDYVGAPWFEGNRDDTSRGFWAVGNGGLSLRRVESCHNVLSSPKLLEDPAKRASANGRLRDVPLVGEAYRFALRHAYQAGFKNNIRSYLRSFQEYEDFFWAFHARKFVDRFVIPEPEEAVRFSFEYAPEYCFKITGGILPFGCHAWKKCGEDFWKPYIEPRL